MGSFEFAHEGDFAASFCQLQLHAISLGAEFYEIAPSLCTECVGHFAEPQCVVVCPVECIIADPENPESPDALLGKFHRLSGETP